MTSLGQEGVALVLPPEPCASSVGMVSAMLECMTTMLGRERKAGHNPS